MESEWKPVMLEVMPYKETGTFIMKVSDDCSQLLDDHIVMAQSMSFSPYKKPFEERITTWESKLVMTQDVMDEWLQCQRQWLYLEPIFSSEDINRQLPVESKRYQTMERIWRKVMNSAKSNPQVMPKTNVTSDFVRVSKTDIAQLGYPSKRINKIRLVLVRCVSVLVYCVFFAGGF